jgi:hypothetical protein
MQSQVLLWSHKRVYEYYSSRREWWRGLRDNIPFFWVISSTWTNPLGQIMRREVKHVSLLNGFVRSTSSGKCESTPTTIFLPLLAFSSLEWPHAITYGARYICYNRSFSEQSLWEIDNFPAFYGTRRLITVSGSYHEPYKSNPHHISFISIIIKLKYRSLSPKLSLSRYSDVTFLCISHLLHGRDTSRKSNSLLFVHVTVIWWRNIFKFLILWLPQVPCCFPSLACILLSSLLSNAFNLHKNLWKLPISYLEYTGWF